MSFDTHTPLLSICIPAYNRPDELERLLKSIDCQPDGVEIVICEDKSPGREAIRARVEAFKTGSPYVVRYFENAENLGFDGNVRQLVGVATGHFVLYMGDDDLFIPGALDDYVVFLKEHIDVRYVLRSYISVHPDGTVEPFRYLSKTTRLSAGEETVAWLFKRSVTICGFTIDREEALKHATDKLDGTLLYQVYMMSQVCLEHDSIYCGFPVVEMVQTFRSNTPMFGNSAAEKGRYTPGKLSADNSINFTKAYFEVTDYLDRERGTHLTSQLQTNLSKYSYPFLSIQRRNGILAFLNYARRLEKECGFGATVYFYIYKWALVILGERLCDRIILSIKRALPATPDL